MKKKNKLSLSKIIWSLGLGFFVSGFVILQQSAWTNYFWAIVGFLVLVFGAFLRGKY